MGAPIADNCGLKFDPADRAGKAVTSAEKDTLKVMANTDSGLEGQASEQVLTDAALGAIATPASGATEGFQSGSKGDADKQTNDEFLEEVDDSLPFVVGDAVRLQKLESLGPEERICFGWDGVVKKSGRSGLVRVQFNRKGEVPINIHVRPEQLKRIRKPDSNASQQSKR